MSTAFKMFCYRYWLESRTKFIIAFILLLLVLLQALNNAADTIKNHPALFGGRELLFTQYVWVIIYKGYFLTIFTLASFLFGVGSPTQEKVSGSALFSLSLPVKRKLLVYAKVTTAAIQVIGLSLGMGLLIPLVSYLFGFYYPVKEALLFSVLIASGGIVFMIFGYLLSLFITKETVIIPIGVAVLSTLFFITKIPALKGLNVFNFMTGAGYLSNNNFLFNEAIDVVGVIIICAVVMLITISLGRIFRFMNV